LRREGVDIRILYDNQEKEQLWTQALDLVPTELGLSPRFYQEEWQSVILDQGCLTLRDYLKARRTGRGTRLSRQQRQMIWSVFEEYRNLLREQRYREPDEAMRDVAQLISAKGSAALPYQAVIVDEAQDMSDAAFTLIRAIAGEPRNNDIFIVGDPHQRIYGRRVVLSRCGIEVRGRSRKLRLNYRTTDEIRMWATQVLQGIEVDDLDEGQDSLNDYRSLMHGEYPVVQGFEQFEDELRYLGQLLSSIQAEEQTLSGVCIALRTNNLLKQYESALQSMSLPTKRIQRNQPDNHFDEGIRLGTMHRVKGLQFNYMILPSLNQDTVPLQTALERCGDAASREQFGIGERCLLHVAATRAKKQVFVSFHGEPSPYVSSHSAPNPN
jgi:superfamily I DNA/RNA helicase